MDHPEDVKEDGIQDYPTQQLSVVQNTDLFGYTGLSNTTTLCCSIQHNNSLLFRTLTCLVTRIPR